MTPAPKSETYYSNLRMGLRAFVARGLVGTPPSPESVDLVLDAYLPNVFRYNPRSKRVVVLDGYSAKVDGVTITLDAGVFTQASRVADLCEAVGVPADVNQVLAAVRRAARANPIPVSALEERDDLCAERRREFYARQAGSNETKNEPGNLAKIAAYRGALSAAKRNVPFEPRYHVQLAPCRANVVLAIRYFFSNGIQHDSTDASVHLVATAENDAGTHWLTLDPRLIAGPWTGEHTEALTKLCLDLGIGVTAVMVDDTVREMSRTIRVAWS